MHEQRFCLDCSHTGPMNVHGLCGTCGSSAVVLAEAIYEFICNFDKSVEEAERIYALQPSKR